MGGGILKNKVEKDQNTKVAESTKAFRNQVLENTKLNALLKDHNNPELLNNKNEVDISKFNQLSEEDKEKLKWNSQNLQDNEVLQKQIMENLGQTIDEPKTPFQAATQPELNEYYQDDDEIDDLNNFALGEPEIKVDELDKKLDENVRPKEQEEDQVEDEEEEEEEAPKPKKSFAELRKQHYQNEHKPAVKSLDDVDDE